MKRSELRKILEENTEKSWRYYRQLPTLYRDLLLWEDYLELLSSNKKARIHGPANRARWIILTRWRIGENAFYLIRHNLQNLCEDV